MFLCFHIGRNLGLWLGLADPFCLVRLSGAFNPGVISVTQRLKIPATPAGKRACGNQKKLLKWAHDASFTIVLFI